jgi:hypothetical protein
MARQNQQVTNEPHDGYWELPFSKGLSKTLRRLLWEYEIIPYGTHDFFGPLNITGQLRCDYIPEHCGIVKPSIGDKYYGFDKYSERYYRDARQLMRSKGDDARLTDFLEPGEFEIIRNICSAGMRLERYHEAGVKYLFYPSATRQSSLLAYYEETVREWKRLTKKGLCKGFDFERRTPKGEIVRFIYETMWFKVHQLSKVANIIATSAETNPQARERAKREIETDAFSQQIMPSEFKIKVRDCNYCENWWFPKDSYDGFVRYCYDMTDGFSSLYQLVREHGDSLKALLRVPVYRNVEPRRDFEEYERDLVSRSLLTWQQAVDIEKHFWDGYHKDFQDAYRQDLYPHVVAALLKRQSATTYRKYEKEIGNTLFRVKELCQKNRDDNKGASCELDFLMRRLKINVEHDFLYACMFYSKVFQIQESHKTRRGRPKEQMINDIIKSLVELWSIPSKAMDTRPILSGNALYDTIGEYLFRLTGQRITSLRSRYNRSRDTAMNLFT